MRVSMFGLKLEYKEHIGEFNQAMQNVCEEAAFAGGKEVDLFEKSFANLVGSHYALGVSSGTDSLILALKALKIGVGDEVITTPMTFFATVEAILHVGATPVFADVQLSDLNLDMTSVRKMISKKTKAVIPVHMFGVAVDMNSLKQLASEYGFYIIEDASHAVGGAYEGQCLGTLGEIGCFSLYPTKTLGAFGNAGIVVTDDELLAKEIKMIANHGRGSDKNIHERVGFTYTLDNLQAAVLNVKMKYLKRKMARKMKLADQYNQAFKELPIRLPVINAHCQPVLYVYTLFCEKRNELRSCLTDKHVETGIYYPDLISGQPAMKESGFKKDKLKNAETMVGQILSIPFYPEMSDEEQKYVISSVYAFFGR